MSYLAELCRLSVDILLLLLLKMVSLFAVQATVHYSNNIQSGNIVQCNYEKKC